MNRPESHILLEGTFAVRSAPYQRAPKHTPAGRAAPLDCGGKRSATPLWGETPHFPESHAAPKSVFAVRLILLLCLIFAASGVANATLESGRVVLPAPDGHPAIEAATVFFDDRSHSIRVLDLAPPGQPRRDFATAMTSTGALAGINGGFFDPEFKPLGLMVSGGQSTGGIAAGALTSGVWVRSPRALLLLRVHEYQARMPGIEPVELLQAGPFLVDGGCIVAGLEATRLRRRSVVVHDQRHAWMLLSTSAASLDGLGRALARPGSLPGIEVVRALNLDGGTSCAWFVARPPAPPHLIRPAKPIRNAIAIHPK